VFRGNKRIDGVLSQTGKTCLEEIIIKMLQDSKHKGQVRLILMDENKLPKQVNPENIWLKTGKPVIIISKESVLDSRKSLKYNGDVFQAAGIDEESAKRVLNKIYQNHNSEALRISGIILESISGLHNI
jgi:endonuclease V-like protein UPF0215 family